MANKFFSTMQAALDINDIVLGLEDKAVKAYVNKMIKDQRNPFYVDTNKAVTTMLDDVEQVKYETLRKAAQKLAYKSLYYAFDYSKKIKLSKPIWNDCDLLVQLGDYDEIHLVYSKKYEVMYNFAKECLILYKKETGEEEHDILTMLYSIEHKGINELREIHEAICHNWFNDLYRDAKCTHYDDIKKVWCVDAYHTDDDNEVGSVVATIDDDCNVTYLDKRAKYCELITNVINDAIKEIQSDDDKDDEDNTNEVNVSVTANDNMAIVQKNKNGDNNLVVSF